MILKMTKSAASSGQWSLKSVDIACSGGASESDLLAGDGNIIAGRSNKTRRWSTGIGMRYMKYMHNAHVLCRYCSHLPALLYSSSAFAYTLDLKQRYKNPWKKYRIKTVHDDDDEQARGTFAMNLYSNIFQIMIVLKSVEKKYPIQCYKSIDNARWSKLWMLKWLHSIWLRSMVRTVRSCWCKLLWCTSTSSWSHQELLLKMQQIQGWSIVQLCIPFWFSTFEFLRKTKRIQFMLQTLFAGTTVLQVPPWILSSWCDSVQLRAIDLNTDTAPIAPHHNPLYSKRRALISDLIDRKYICTMRMP